ncbi:hypothetical protein B0T20DRAFT_151056 [Sordaria brevicollis]|uniref:Uncharacterized protein n=1 Tax=Sordaria brevicollis TaxID=83679 RepID=A0AAE0PIT1_SORBR|nr:hypothetical protein B0T20DRAFT_151056 [Sordaria brevicollis]
MNSFNFLRRNDPVPSGDTATAPSGAAPTGDNLPQQPQPALLPAVQNNNSNNQQRAQQNQNPYTYADSVSSLSSDDEYDSEDYEDEEVYSVSSRSSDTAPLSPRTRQQRARYPSASTLNHPSHQRNQNQNQHNMGNGHGHGHGQMTNSQEDLYCDLEAQLGIHPALRMPPPAPGHGTINGVPANFPPPPPIPQDEREMAEVERRSSSRFFLPRMSFRFLGGNRPRPASSHYSGDGLPPATEVNFPTGAEYPASPKSPAFRIGEQQLPSTRLHVPGVERTWSRESNGPPTRDGSAPASRGGGDETRGASRYGFGLLGGNRSASRDGRQVRVTEPRRAHHSSSRRHRERGERGGERSEHRRRRERSDGSGSGAGASGSGSGHRSHRSHRSRRDPSGRSGTTRRHRDGRDEERRKRRKRKHGSSRRHEGSGSGSHSRSAATGDPSERGKKRAPPPKHFLFCFPWVKSRTKRTLILRSFVSGLFLACLLIIYLALAVTHTVDGSEFTIAMILVVILGAIVFLHSVIRLIMLAFKGGRSKRDGDLESGQAGHHGVDIHAPAGPYAIPPTPIRVILARDEEAAGVPSDAAVSKPPEYGQWRESVRVDPNRIYWMRNEAVTPELPTEEAASEGARSRAGSRDGPNPGTLRRPPSYSSDDGVSYVVEAQPRSIAPAADVPSGARAGRRLA